MYYIDTLSEYGRRIDERHKKIRRPKKTGNEVAHFLGRNEKVGTEIFRTINENVDTLERLIESYNEKHETDLGKSPLEVKIDKTKLDIKYLISLTKLSKAPFIADVIVSNILNYKILIRPIKNARIIALAYRYYLAMVRHCLQSSLILIELSADTFFSQINANLSGRRKQMKELLANAIVVAKENTLNFMKGQSFTDENGKTISISKILSKNQLETVSKLIKNLNTMNRNSNEFDRLNGYNQNVFQDSGKNIESMLKANQDKELQTLAEQFANIANSTTGFSKEDKADAREHVSNYAAAVKMSTERRAMAVCEQINLNMFEIVKMFSIRNIDGYSEVFEEESSLDRKIEELDKERDEIRAKQAELESSFTAEVNKAVAEQLKNVDDKEKEKMLEHWKTKGIDKLCSPEEFKKIVYENKDVRKIMKDAGFNDTQIHNIVDRTETVAEYGKIHYGEFADYLKRHGDMNINGKDYSYDDVKNQDDDKLFCWMRNDSAKYKDIKGLNRTVGGDKEKETKHKTK